MQKILGELQGFVGHLCPLWAQMSDSSQECSGTWTQPLFIGGKMMIAKVVQRDYERVKIGGEGGGPFFD